MNKNALIQKTKVLFKYYFQLFGLYILFFICVAILQNVFPELDLKKYSDNSLLEMARNNKAKAILLAVIMAPIFEELMFRTLVKPKIYELILFISIWILFFGGLFFSLELNWYYKYLLTSILVVGLFFLLKHLIATTSLEKMKSFLEHYQSLTLQLTAVAFGFVHIFNYVNSFRIDSVLFLLIVPRIIAGHMFGKIKIKNNHIIWPMLLHAINNGVALLVILSRF